MVKKQTTTKKKADQKQDNRQTLKDKIITIIKLNESLLKKEHFPQHVTFKDHALKTLADFTIVLKLNKKNPFINNDFIINSLISEADTIIKLLEQCNEEKKIQTFQNTIIKNDSNLNTSYFGLLLFNVEQINFEKIKKLEEASGINITVLNKNIYKILFESQSIFVGSIKESIQNNEKLKLAFEIVKEVFDLLKISF